MNNQMVKISVNYTVKVKLTPEARDHLLSKGIVPREANQEGYSVWQLWELFEQFGDAIAINKPTCFEGGIFIDRDELGLT